MVETASRHKKYEEHVPEETRQHFRAAREEMRKGLETFFPEGFLEHRKSARREMLLAWRSMLDSAIQRMDEKA
jgi:flagellar biosynthesis/type III secretory pathway protein FliH